MQFFLSASLIIIFISQHPFILRGNLYAPVSHIHTEQRATVPISQPEKVYTFTESELRKNYQYHFIAFVLMNGRTMKDIFDFETVSPETVYEFMTETDYENKLYGPLFLE